MTMHTVLARDYRAVRLECHEAGSTVALKFTGYAPDFRCTIPPMEPTPSDTPS